MRAGWEGQLDMFAFWYGNELTEEEDLEPEHKV
jgi:hypothetical protein